MEVATWDNKGAIQNADVLVTTLSRNSPKHYASYAPKKFIYIDKSDAGTLDTDWTTGEGCCPPDAMSPSSHRQKAGLTMMLRHFETHCLPSQPAGATSASRPPPAKPVRRSTGGRIVGPDPALIIPVLASRQGGRHNPREPAGAGGAEAHQRDAARPPQRAPGGGPGALWQCARPRARAQG